MFPPLTTVRPGFEQLGVAAMRETLYLLGAGEENSFGSSQHGVGLVSAQMVNRSSLGPVRRRYGAASSRFAHIFIDPMTRRIWCVTVLCLQ